MPHLNGAVEWVPADKAPSDGTIVYGFFDAYITDDGIHAHIRPVRRYKSDGDWFCGVSGHNLGLRGPIMISERIPYPTRAQVRDILQQELDKQHDNLVQSYPTMQINPRPTASEPRF